MRSVKLGSSPALAPAPKPSRAPAESKPAVTRPSEPASKGTRVGIPQDEFIRPGGASRSRGPLTAPVEGAAPVLPKELEPYRQQLDDLALKLSSNAELVANPGKLKQAITEGIKNIEGFPLEHLGTAVGYVEHRVRDAYSGGKERFG
jgi:hypothetical protein